MPVTDAHGMHTAVEFGPIGKQMLYGMRRAIAAMVRSGTNVIIDDIILEPEFLDDYLQAFAGLYVLFVGVQCPREVLSARENARPGRFPGTAVGHFEVCHAHDLYDVRVDTSKDLPPVCARQVIEFMQTQTPQAFTNLSQQKRANCP